MDNARMTSKGQITIPKHIRDKLDLAAGKKVYIIQNGDDIIISGSPEHPAIRAMKKLQKGMEGKFEKAGIYTEDDIIKLCKEVRAEVEGL